MANNTFRENALRIAAVLGLIAILLLGAWGIIQLAFYLPTLFSGLGRAKEAITVTVPAQTTSDQAFTLTWRHTGGSGEHSYAVSYSCAQGLQFAVPVPTGAFQLVPCDTPFNYINASSSMPMVPVLTADAKQATTTISVAATKLSDGTVSVRGSGRTTVAASTTPATANTGSTSGGTTTAKPKPSTTYVPSGRTQNLYGLPDLAVEIVQAPQVANVGSRVTLQFVITNIGSNVAPAGWMFNAVLPYQPIYVHPSGGQQALYPGDKIVYTLGYDVVPSGQYGYEYFDYYSYGGQAQATIEIDPMVYLQESNKLNNTAVASYQVY